MRFHGRPLKIFCPIKTGKIQISIKVKTGRQIKEREKRKREGRENPEIDEVDRRMEENTERVKKLIVRDKEELERLELKRQIEKELNEITERLKEQLYS